MTDLIGFQADALDALTHPDPDPDLLPDLPAESALVLQLDTAGHLCRAIVKAEARLEAVKAQARKDAQAWADLIAKAEARTATWRKIIADWMQRTEVKQLKTPWFVAFLQKGRRRLSWEDEDRVIGVLDALGATDAIQTKRSVKRKEFATVFDSVPTKFDGIVKDETGDPVLVIKEQK